MKKFLIPFALICIVFISAIPVNKSIHLNGVYKVSENGVEYKYHNTPSKTLKVDTTAIVTMADFESMNIAYLTGSNEPELHIILNKEGSKKFAKATRDNLGKQFAIILNNKLLAAPYVQSEIKEGNIIVQALDTDLIVEIGKEFKKHQKKK